MGERFYSEDGSTVPVTQFPYDEVDRNLSNAQSDDVHELAIEQSVKLTQKIQRWVYQDGKNNNNGILIRSTIVSWATLPELEPMTLTDLSMGLGMKKQSVGRWVDNFKKEFPNFRSPHMRRFQ